MVRKGETAAGQKTSQQARIPAVDEAPRGGRACAPSVAMRTVCPILFVAAACGSVHFTDPNQPQLFRSTVEYAAGAQSEPLAWMPLIELLDEGGIGCAAVQQWTAQPLRASVRAT